MERNTRQRTAIRESITVAGRPLLPQEVLALAQGHTPGLSIATVYRNLRMLVDDGVLRAVMLPGENARYELAHTGHHHHFQCRQCQRVFEVEACPGNLASLAPAGFTVEDHDLTLYGRCGDCVGAAVPAGAGTRSGHDAPHQAVHVHGPACAGTQAGPPGPARTGARPLQRKPRNSA